MSTIKLPPLPAPLRARIFDGMASVYSPDQLRARDLEVARVALEAAARVLDGECLDHLQRAIRNLKVSHAN